MQVSVETTSNLGRKLTVGIPSDKVESAVETKLKDAAKNIRIDGFRPGKVPMREVRRRFGPSVRQEVVGELIQQSFYEAITQEKLQPAGMPAIEEATNEKGKDVEFVATFEVFPEIELNNIDGETIEKPVAEIVETDVDDMIETLLKQRATFEPKDGAAAMDDEVTIDFVGTKDGEVFEGGSAEGTKLKLGSGQMIPGFEDGLVGAVKGDEKVLDLTFPEDYQSEELKGADVQFKVTVQEVSESITPEVNEEFIKSFGVEEGTDEAFRENIKKNMTKELDNAVKAKVKNQVMDALVAKNEIDCPKALIDQEINRQKQQMFQQFGGGANLDLDLLPNDMFEERAEKSVKLGLLFSEVMKALEITQADPDKVKAFIEDMASTYEKPEEVINWYYGNQEQLQQIESAVLEDQVVEAMLEKATVTEKACSYQEAIKPAEIPEESEDE